MKIFSWQVIKYLVQFIKVLYIISECLFVIGAEIWEEFAEKRREMPLHKCDIALAIALALEC